MVDVMDCCRIALNIPKYSVQNAGTHCHKIRCENSIKCICIEFHCVNCVNNSITRKGGGCWILHKPNIISNRVSHFESKIDFVEDIWIEIAQPTGRRFLCTVYITSMVNRSSLYEHFFDKVRENLATLDSHDRVLIVGDINFSNIHWSKSNDGILHMEICLMPILVSSLIS